MKFLCEHCKAKYQIADEKVVGRTVRMKCRKCGGSIEVRAAVTETSVAAKASDVAGSDAARALPAKPAPPRSSPLATSLSQSSRPAAPKRGAGGSADASSLAGAFQRNVDRDEDATAASLDLRELSAADEWYVAVNGVPVGPVRIGEVRRKAAMGAVTEDSLCWQEGMEEWRAVRTVAELAAVVREAASGTRPSQLPAPPPPPRAHASRGTGQHAAQPSHRDVPKAPAAPSRFEAEDDGAPTLVGRSPLLDAEEEHAAQPPHAPIAPQAPRAPARPNGAADPFAMQASDPFRQGAAAPAANGFGGAGASALAAPASPFAGGGAGAGPFGGTAASPFAPPAAPDPFAAPPAYAAPAPIVVAPQRPIPWIPIGLTVMFGCFGTVGAYFTFGPKPPPVVVVAPTATVAAPVAPTAPSPTATAAPVASVAAPVETAPAAAPPTDTTARVASASPRPAGSTGAAIATKGPGAAITDPALRDLIGGAGTGPSTGPGGPSSGGGAQLTEDEVKQVVAQHSLGVRRTCWDRTSSTTPSVNVTVKVVIAGSGQVTSTSANGNDPVVGHCLEEEIRRWRWPGGGEVNVPFHFLRQ